MSLRGSPSARSGSPQLSRPKPCTRNKTERRNRLFGTPFVFLLLFYVYIYLRFNSAALCSERCFPGTHTRDINGVILHTLYTYNTVISNCPCDEANVAIMEGGKNKIYVDGDKCISCGECLRNCSHNARDYQDDTERFFADLRTGKKISIIAAPAFRTNFSNYERLIGLLRKMGVSTFFDTSFGADICTWAYLR